MNSRSAFNRKKLQLFSHTSAAAAILVSVLQGIWFGLDQSWTSFNSVAVWIAVANLVAGAAFKATNRFRFLLFTLVLYGVQLGLFLAAIFGREVVIAPSMLRMAIVLIHAAITLSAGLVLLARLSLLKSVSISLLLAGVFFLWEGFAEMTQKPASAVRQDRGEKTWWFRSEGGNEAQMLFPSDRPDVVRIDILKLKTKNAYDVQLNLPHLKAEAGQNYLLSFRARSDSPRDIWVGFAKSHEPWNGLGLYKKFQLAPNWGIFKKTFTATEGDENARIHFDVGGNSTPVEVSSVLLHRVKDGMRIEPDFNPLNK